MNKNLVFILFILWSHQSVAQIELTINARQLTPMKLSEISEQSHCVALNIDSVSQVIATDRFLFASRGGNMRNHLFQFDFSGKLIRTFEAKSGFSEFICDIENKRIVIPYSREATVWDFNGSFLKKIQIPENSSVIGFAGNNIWMVQNMKESDDKIRCRIVCVNYENEHQEIILERIFPVFTIMNAIISYKAWFSSARGRLYTGFHENIFYEIDGKDVRPAFIYNIENYKEDYFDYAVHEKMVAGRFFTIKYGSFADTKLFWYDTKEKKTWQMQMNYGKGGIVDDIYYTGNCDYYKINGNYLIFRKNKENLPKGMKIDGGFVFFIIKLKQ